uniref:C-type lectin domain-containing protein n=1 Tax=Seriola lalandi dorsalis TaxID=1841481 RepID=A0A3B4Y053_SERLL
MFASKHYFASWRGWYTLLVFLNRTFSLNCHNLYQNHCDWFAMRVMLVALTLQYFLSVGHCPFSTCHFYEYHFIEETKNWDEAKSYCRQKYTDLATVYNMTDIKRLRNLEAQTKAWIGLHNNNTGEREWHWSLPGVEYNETHTLWDEDEPNDVKGHENCVSMNTALKLYDLVCDQAKSFICYDGEHMWLIFLLS